MGVREGSRNISDQPTIVKELTKVHILYSDRADTRGQTVGLVTSYQPVLPCCATQFFQLNGIPRNVSEYALL